MVYNVRLGKAYLTEVEMKIVLPPSMGAQIGRGGYNYFVKGERG